MTTALGFKGGVVGYGVESTWGTGVAPTVFNELKGESINKEIEANHSEAIPDISVVEDEFALGAVTVSGDIELEMRYQGMESLLKQALGTCTTAETASFIVTASNKLIDFNIGAGALAATVSEGTYAAGTDQTTAGSLCKAIYDAIHAAEAVGTYTVTFSSSTKKFTITRSAGTFSILWNTGTNKATAIAALIGYATAADDTGGLTYTSDTALVPVYTHTFTIAEDLPKGLTFEIDRDQSAFTIEGGKINTMALAVESSGFLAGTFGIVGEDVTTGTATAATLPTAPLVHFTHGALSYNSGTKSITNVSVELNNNLKTDRRFVGSRLISEPLRNGKIEVTGSFQIEFEGLTEYNDFVAGTSRAVTLTFTSTTNIKTGFVYTMTVTMPLVKVTAFPVTVSEAGALMVELPFKAYGTDSTTRELSIAIRNGLATVA